MLSRLTCSGERSGFRSRVGRDGCAHELARVVELVAALEQLEKAFGAGLTEHPARAVHEFLDTVFSRHRPLGRAGNFLDAHLEATSFRFDRDVVVTRDAGVNARI